MLPKCCDNVLMDFGYFATPSGYRPRLRQTFLRKVCGLARALAAALAISLASSAAMSVTAVELDAARQPIALGGDGEYWIDTKASLGPEQLLADADLPWKATPPRGIYPLQPGQALWIRFSVPPTPNTERWVLEIPYPALDRASLYTQGKTGQWNEQRTGDLTAVNQWPTPHRYPLLALNLSAEKPTHYLLRIENVTGFSAPLLFVSARHVLQSEQKVSLLLGFYCGMALLGCIVGFTGAVWLRDRAYFYYGLCCALVGLTLATMTGVAALQLWPDSPNWADRSLTVLATLMMTSILLLNATVVSLAQRSRTLNTLVWAVALGGLVLALMLGVTDSALRLKLVLPYVLLAPTLTLAINLWAWRHGERFGGWLLLGATPFALGWAISAARSLQWLPLSFATEQGALASIAFQLPALLAVLVLRSRQSRENRRRLRGLDRIDPTTGLINGHVFSERLTRMMIRSERHRQQSAVMLIDIVNSNQTQRDFGSKESDQLPLRVASRLMSTAREIDSAARLSECRFGMLVEGPFTTEDAATLGPRIVARCLMPYKGLHVDCVAQVRVAYALVPHQNCDAKTLLSLLEQQLAGASRDGKKAVFMLHNVEPPVRRFRIRKKVAAAAG